MTFESRSTARRLAAILLMSAATLAGCASSRDAPVGTAASAGPTVIAFGSCNKERGTQEHWARIAARDPELFLFIGDNVYADIRPDATGREVMATPETAAAIVESYQTLAAHPEWQTFESRVPILATWDDHDYGDNDAGREWRFRVEAEAAYFEFFGVPADDERRMRPGIHHARTFGEPGRRVQVIMLDTRSFRDRLDRRPPGAPHGPYGPTEDTARTMLGEAQWTWLETQLREPADVRLLVSSVQVVANEHGWETWGNMPHERDRLYGLIDRTGAEGVVFLTGDRHFAEASCDRGQAGDPVPYPMWDFTSSGLNDGGPRPVGDPNRFRVGPVHRQTNYGLIEIHWDLPTGPVIRFEARGSDDRILVAADVELDSLRPASPRR